MSRRRILMCTAIALAGRGASAYLFRPLSAGLSALSPSSARCAGSYVGRKRSAPSMQQHPEAGSPLDRGEIPVLDGFLAVHKPEEWTSADVVKRVRGMLERSMRQMTGQRVNVKVGHGGTLDPMATGVLVLGIGSGCKEMEAYLKGSKAYKAIALLGTEYDTLDRTGTPLETVDVSHVTVDMLDKALEGFRGEIMQRPPAFSAIRKGGKRLYDLARKGEMVIAEPRPVVVEHLSLVPGHELPEFGLDVQCQGGTYVRSLISDIARAVDARAHMTGLVRTKQGPFQLSDCLEQSGWGDFDRLVSHLAKCNAIVAKVN